MVFLFKLEYIFTDSRKSNCSHQFDSFLNDFKFLGKIGVNMAKIISGYNTHKIFEFLGTSLFLTIESFLITPTHLLSHLEIFFKSLFLEYPFLKLKSQFPNLSKLYMVLLNRIPTLESLIAIAYLNPLTPRAIIWPN